MKGQLLEWFYAKFPARKLYDQSQGHGLFKSHGDLIIACMRKSGWQFYGSWEMAVFFLEHRWVEIISFLVRSGQKYGDQIYYKIDAVRSIYVDLLIVEWHLNLISFQIPTFLMVISFWFKMYILNFLTNSLQQYFPKCQ